MVIGFLAVWKTDWFLQNLGDLSMLFGSSQQWLSWKVVGLILMLVGFLVAFGLIQLFFAVTFGQLFRLGISG